MFENLLRAVRRFGSGRFGTASTRGRQPRLVVLEHASIAAGRQIILVRRDNVEHLLMIGGPSDIVVEANIVRGAPAADEVMLPRAIPFPETGSWPPQPVTPWPRPEPRIERLRDEPARAMPPEHHTEAASHRAREPLPALHEKIPASLGQRGNRAGGTGRPHSVEPRRELRAEPHAALGRSAAAEIVAAADQSQAEMMQRFQAAVHKFRPEGDGRAQSAPPPRKYAAAVEAAPYSPELPRRPRSGEARRALAEERKSRTTGSMRV